MEELPVCGAVLAALASCPLVASIMQPVHRSKQHQSSSPPRSLRRSQIHACLWTCHRVVCHRWRHRLPGVSQLGCRLRPPSIVYLRRRRRRIAAPGDERDGRAESWGNTSVKPHRPNARWGAYCKLWRFMTRILQLARLEMWLCCKFGEPVVYFTLFFKILT
jgi:hypothetical protein